MMLTCILVAFSSAFSKELRPPKPVYPIPTQRQMDWHEMEQYAFIHFSINTFTNKEWGYGDESPQRFNPTDFDAEQWARVIKEAGLKAIILTSKHHDGFCLWPSKFTDHTVASSPFKDGKGDIVKDVRDACEKYGLKFGIYLSPWDRNHPDYGKPEYIVYYRNQLKEVFAQYGPIFEMWFDGANGGDGYYGNTMEMRNIDGERYYDWPETLRIIRSIEPNVIFFSDAGPDVRWCGNERGYIGETNWNPINGENLYPGKPGISDLLNTGQIEGDDWIPAEVDVSIRPGWFYHSEEDTQVKTASELFEIYLNSVGRGSNLLLNIPPDPRGQIHENDMQALREWKRVRDDAFAINLASDTEVLASNERGASPLFRGKNTIDGNPMTYWATDDGLKEGWIELNFDHPTHIHYVLIQEYIRLGQRVKQFSIEAQVNDRWVLIGDSTTIGYKKILPVDPVTTSKIRVQFLEARGCLAISNIEVY